MRMYDEISPRWKQDAKRSTKPLTILSPYITGDVALNLVKGKAHARIYTLFEAEVFVARGSSLDDIKRLMKDHQVYRLDGLHAKLVTDNASFVTVGSQNLTRGGQFNNELSVHLWDKPARQQAMAIVEPWLEGATLITPAMVADMEKDIERLRAMYRKFKEECDKHQGKVDAAAKQYARRERQAAQAKNRAVIGAKLNKALSSGATKTGLVTRKDVVSTPFLKIDNNASLLTWERQRGNDIELRKGMRYLCFLDSNAFGWARVAEKQITRIGLNIKYGQGTIKEFPTLTMVLSVRPKDLVGKPDGTNLVVKLLDGKKSVCTVPVSFLLDEVTAFSARRPKFPRPPRRPGHLPSPPPASPALSREVTTWIAANKTKFELLVCKRATESFTYAEGRKEVGRRQRLCVLWRGWHSSQCERHQVRQASDPVRHTA
ncbi:phospholipase D-like domain-containing protein [Pseudomonas frederiksbergensis]